MSSNSNDNVNSNMKTIDVRGLYCPEPVFRTKIEIERMTKGDTLRIVSDDQTLRKNIKMG